MKKEIEIDGRFGKEYAGKYVFETISWGRSNQITSDCTKINPATKQSSVDLRRLQALLVDATLTTRPKVVTLEHLLSEGSDGIPIAFGEVLASLTDYVNGYSEEDREELKKLKRQWGLE